MTEAERFLHYSELAAQFKQMGHHRNQRGSPRQFARPGPAIRAAGYRGKGQARWRGREAGGLISTGHGRCALPAVRGFGRVKTWFVTGFPVRHIKHVRQPRVCDNQREVTVLQRGIIRTSFRQPQEVCRLIAIALRIT